MSVAVTTVGIVRRFTGPARRPAGRSIALVVWIAVLAFGAPAGQRGIFGDEPGQAAAAAAATDEAKPSQYAPAADLVEQAEYYIGRLSEALASEKDFDEYMQKRSKNDAHTLAVISLVLAKHDTPNKLQSAALLPAVRRLGEVIGDYPKAAAALAEVKTAAAQEGPAAANLTWEPVAPLPALMQQVPSVNNALRRGLDANRFKRQKKQMAGESATLAAIAQASSFDLSASGEEEKAQWQKFCRETRDVAGHINAAVHGDDLPAAQAGAKVLLEHCDACHEVFRGGK